MIKFMWGAIFTTALGLVASLVLYIFQDELKRNVMGVDLVADVFIAPWQPYPEAGTEVSRTPAPTRFSRNWLSEPGELPFALLEISNRGTEDIKDLRVNFPMNMKVDMLIVREGPDKERRSYLQVHEARIPHVSAKEKIYVYIWADSPVGVDYYLEKMSVFSHGKSFQIITNGYERYDERVLGLSNQWWIDLLPSLIVVMFILMTVIALGGMVGYSAYSQKLLKDENFYIDEAARLESEGRRFAPRMKW